MHSKTLSQAQHSLNSKIPYLGQSHKNPTKRAQTKLENRGIDTLLQDHMAIGVVSLLRYFMAKESSSKKSLVLSNTLA